MRYHVSIVTPKMGYIVAVHGSLRKALNEASIIRRKGHDRIKHLTREQLSPMLVRVLDNGSTDGSVSCVYQRRFTQKFILKAKTNADRHSA